MDNFETLEEADTFMNGAAFVENPYGTDFDRDELLAKLRQGVSERDLKRRVEIGPRARPRGRNVISRFEWIRAPWKCWSSSTYNPEQHDDRYGQVRREGKVMEVIEDQLTSGK